MAWCLTNHRKDIKFARDRQTDRIPIIESRCSHYVTLNLNPPSPPNSLNVSYAKLIMRRWMFKSYTLYNRAQAKVSMVRELFCIMRTPTDATSVRSNTLQYASGLRPCVRPSVRPSDYHPEQQNSVPKKVSNCTERLSPVPQPVQKILTFNGTVLTTDRQVSLCWARLIQFTPHSTSLGWI
jgi:hypothetical protein